MRKNENKCGTGRGVGAFILAFLFISCYSVGDVVPTVKTSPLRMVGSAGEPHASEKVIEIADVASRVKVNGSVTAFLIDEVEYATPAIVITQKPFSTVELSVILSVTV